ncbi:MAG: biotin--[acetyl-CoA-carboxylase] ligase [Planctomycetes bacterium]|nr:biotin--[acetyl-CoA-carboxylase] ligase [Planctomycetota bacterium]
MNASPPDPRFAPLDVARLRVQYPALPIEHRASVGSTNDLARELAAAGTGAPLLVLAEQQTAGRGRGSNRWWTGAGSLALSYLLDPATYGIARRYSAMMPLAAANAIIDIVARRAEQLPVGLHWPNDVYVGPRKLAGILVEGLADGRQIVGIGLNVNNRFDDAPAELQTLVATLADLTGAPVDRTELLAELLAALEANWRQLGAQPEALGRASNGRCLQVGEILTVRAGESTVTGTCLGIADDGALLLETATGREALYSGVLVKD